MSLQRTIAKWTNGDSVIRIAMAGPFFNVGFMNITDFSAEYSNYRTSEEALLAANDLVVKHGGDWRKIED